MALDTQSGSMDFTQNSGSHYSAAAVLESPWVEFGGARRPSLYFGIQPVVKNYFQRVYDAGTSDWCYYVKRYVDPTPAASETTPNYTGAISKHSIIEILDD
jgi:hypothetical protein